MGDESTYSLVNVNVDTVGLGRLAKPAIKLLDVFGKIVGDLMDPDLIKARAESRKAARTLKAEGKIEVKELWEERVRKREERRQENLDAVFDEAMKALPPIVNDEPVGEDWIWQFVEHVQDIGDKEMRSVWSRLLAGEVASPGKYSLLTMTRLKTMRPEEALMFQALLTCMWRINGSRKLILLNFMYNPDDQTLSPYIRQDELLKLDTHGLIRYHDYHAYPFEQLTSLTYFGDTFNMADCLRSSGGDPILQTNATLTEVGIELLDITPAKADGSYKQNILDTLRYQKTK